MRISERNLELEARMGDDELAEIRNKRMAEMRAQAGGAGGDQQQQMQERAKQMEDMKNGILSQVLDQKVKMIYGSFMFASCHCGQS